MEPLGYNGGSGETLGDEDHSLKMAGVVMG